MHYLPQMNSELVSNNKVSMGCLGIKSIPSRHRILLSTSISSALIPKIPGKKSGIIPSSLPLSQKKRKTGSGLAISASIGGNMLSGLKNVLSKVKLQLTLNRGHFWLVSLSLQPVYEFWRSVCIQGGSSNAAAAFSDSAPSWESLEKLLIAREEDLGVQPPDLEAVCGIWSWQVKNIGICFFLSLYI